MVWGWYGMGWVWVLCGGYAATAQRESEGASAETAASTEEASSPLPQVIA
jgi:hypothetical protein